MYRLNKRMHAGNLIAIPYSELANGKDVVIWLQSGSENGIISELNRVSFYF